jgi:quercetin dioxygenase-like cupin family protein
MKIFRFDPEVGKSIEHFQSSGFLLSRVAHLLEEAVVSCAYLGANGLIGDHQATLPQLFLVVVGKGWVRGGSSDKISIEAGQAAYWEKGEWHESGTETGMTAIVIEGTNFDPAKLMPMLHVE